MRRTLADLLIIALSIAVFAFLFSCTRVQVAAREGSQVTVNANKTITVTTDAQLPTGSGL